MKFKSKAAVSHYLLAVALVMAATPLTRKCLPVLGEISPLFFVAVMLSAWFGGLGPGLLATALTAISSVYYFYDFPAGSAGFGWDDAVRLVVFLMLALLISFLLTMRRRAEKELIKANENLEIRVVDRTRELVASNRKVRESEDGLKALIEGVTDCAICLLDQTGHVVQWNSGAQRIQGYTEAEIFNQHFSIFSAPQKQLMQRAAGQLAFAAKTGRDEEEGWRIRKDGSAFRASVIISPLYHESGVLRGFAHVARDITEVKRLEQEVIEISEKEQRRIGHDLHDGLGQELTGLAFLCENVCRKLTNAARPEAVELTRISGLMNLAIEQTRDLAKGLAPVEFGSDGLSAALQNLTTRVHDLYGLPCEFHRGRAAEVGSHVAAMHLYRIAQEAVSNAARHSQANRIWVSLDGTESEVVLSVEDNGKGLDRTKTDSRGMGLHLMPYRARTIGATFELLPRSNGGTIIRCIYRKSLDSLEQTPEQ